MQNRQTSFGKYKYRLRFWLDTYNISTFYSTCTLLTDLVAKEQSGWRINNWFTINWKPMVFSLLASSSLAFSIYWSQHQTRQITINFTGIWLFGGRGVLFIIRWCLLTLIRISVDFYVNMSLNTMGTFLNQGLRSVIRGDVIWNAVLKAAFVSDEVTTSAIRNNELNVWNMSPSNLNSGPMFTKRMPEMPQKFESVMIVSTFNLKVSRSREIWR